MKYIRIEPAYVLGNKCLFENGDRDDVLVETNPIGAKDGDMFCAADIDSWGAPVGVIWTPESKIGLFNTPGTRVSLREFENFEAAQADGLRTMSVMAFTVSPKELHEKLFENYDWQPESGADWHKFLNLLVEKKAYKHIHNAISANCQALIAGASGLDANDKRKIIDRMTRQEKAKKAAPKM